MDNSLRPADDTLKSADGSLLGMGDLFRDKTAGVMGCEIWVKVTNPGEAAPTGADGLSFLSLDTASPYIAEYDGANGGKTAHYMLRWVKSSGEKGPWSETVSATITA